MLDSDDEPSLGEASGATAGATEGRDAAAVNKANWPPTDDDYRAGRLRALHAAVKTVSDPDLGDGARVQQVGLLSAASVATLLDAQGAYIEPPSGQRSKDEYLPGRERLNFNGRIYQVEFGVYPEFDAARRLASSLYETSDQPKPLGSAATTPQVSDELLQQVLARAGEAIRVVEGDMASKQIRFR